MKEKEFNNFGKDPVRCNNCMWEGTEQDLYSFEDKEDIEYCPNCNKAGCIMDI